MKTINTKGNKVPKMIPVKRNGTVHMRRQMVNPTVLPTGMSTRTLLGSPKPTLQTESVHELGEAMIKHGHTGVSVNPIDLDKEIYELTSNGRTWTVQSNEDNLTIDGSPINIHDFASAS